MKYRRFLWLLAFLLCLTGCEKEPVMPDETIEPVPPEIVTVQLWQPEPPAPPEAHDLSMPLPVKTTAVAGISSDLFSTLQEENWVDIHYRINNIERGYTPYVKVAHFGEELTVCLLQLEMNDPRQWLLVWDGTGYLFDAPFCAGYWWYDGEYYWEDLDGDGQRELLALACVGSGTNFHVETAFVFQKDETGVTMYCPDDKWLWDTLTASVAPLVDHEARTVTVNDTTAYLPTPLETETLGVYDYVFYEFDGTLTARYLLECHHPDWVIPVDVDALDADMTFADGMFTLSGFRVERQEAIDLENIDNQWIYNE